MKKTLTLTLLLLCVIAGTADAQTAPFNPRGEFPQFPTDFYSMTSGDWYDPNMHDADEASLKVAQELWKSYMDAKLPQLPISDTMATERRQNLIAVADDFYYRFVELMIEHAMGQIDINYKPGIDEPNWTPETLIGFAEVVRAYSHYQLVNHPRGLLTYRGRTLREAVTRHLLPKDHERGLALADLAEKGNDNVVKALRDYFVERGAERHFPAVTLATEMSWLAMPLPLRQMQRFDQMACVLSTGLGLYYQHRERALRAKKTPRGTPEQVVFETPLVEQLLRGPNAPCAVGKPPSYDAHRQAMYDRCIARQKRLGINAKCQPYDSAVPLSELVNGFPE